MSSSVFWWFSRCAVIPKTASYGVVFIALWRVTFVVYEACIVYSHHLSMFLLFDPIIIDLIFSFHVLLLLSTRPCVVGVLAALWDNLILFSSQNNLSFALQNSPPLSVRIFFRVSIGKAVILYSIENFIC